MIITDKHGNMIDTVEMVENECYTIEDIEHVVKTDIYISALVKIRICDCGKKALEVCDPEEGKEAQYHLRQFIKHMKKLGRYY